MPIITNNSGLEDGDGSYKTYYIEIEREGTRFYKFGATKGSLRERFAAEPKTTRITIHYIWRHASETHAYAHEASLFKKYKGDRPYFGSAGPLLGGGNTEVFSHDILGGKLAPHSYFVRIFFVNSQRRHFIAYSGINPYNAFKNLTDSYPTVRFSFGPPQLAEGPYIQIPDLSSETHVTLATDGYLEKTVERSTESLITRKIATSAISSWIKISSWADYSKMRFNGNGWRQDNWTEWN